MQADSVSFTELFIIEIFPIFILFINFNKSIFPLCAGFLEQIGHKDIYINGGVNQTECMRLHKDHISNIAGSITDWAYHRNDSDTCEHSFASNFYSGAIKMGQILKGYLCKSTVDAVKGFCDKKKEIDINLSDTKSLKKYVPLLSILDTQIEFILFSFFRLPSILFLSTATRANKVFDPIE